MSAYRAIAESLVRMHAAETRRDIENEEVARHERDLTRALTQLETEIKEGAALREQPTPVSHQEDAR